jgi:cell division protein FtsI/penicillin-binding protein 2
VVKGASHTVSYLNNLIDVGKKINDSCVKLYQVPMKCSFKRLGYIDDISALKLSSNYYQFINAIKSTNNSYYPNIKIYINEDNFNKYRDVFKKFGLGSKTNIDLYGESTGIRGKKVSMDLLLNYVIGQYDTYTPIELTSYINTIANRGKRLSLSLLKKNNEVIDNIEMDDKYWDRIEEGFYQVVNRNDGTGLVYSDKKINAVGKTGTAQNYISDSLMTINSTYIMYAPRNDPKYSVVIVTPNISYINDLDYIAPINRIISKKITNYVFENN